MNTIHADVAAPSSEHPPWQDIRTARLLLMGQRVDEALAILNRAELSLQPPDRHARPATPPDRAGGCLSVREHDVLRWMCRGLSNKRIAMRLAIAPETVKAHLKRIFLKLEVGSRAEAVFCATRLGLLSE